MHDTIGVDRQAVDGEVAPLRIADPVAAERDLRLAAERLGILAQGGDFERVPIDHQRHGAVLESGGAPEKCASKTRLITTSSNEPIASLPRICSGQDDCARSPERVAIKNSA